MLAPAPDYDTLVSQFRWTIPARYNIGVDVCDRWAAVEPGRPAIIDVGPDGRVTPFTYGEMRDASNRLANGLARARHIEAATASPCSCRKAPPFRSCMWRPTSSEPSRCRSPPSSGSMRSAIGSGMRA